MKSDAKTRLIHAMAALLQTQGYSNTGLNQIVELSEAPKGSLYHYFPAGKVELAVAAIEYSSAALGEQLSRLCAGAPSAKAGLGAIIDFFADELQYSAFAKGCPVATVTLEQSAHDDVIGQACAAAYAQWQRGIEVYLRRHGVNGASGKAEFFLICIEGALTLARAHRSVEPLRRVKRQLPTLLGAANKEP